MKPISPTEMIPVTAQNEISHLNSTLMLVDCVGRTLDVVLRYWLCKLVKILSFRCKVPSWCVLTKKKWEWWWGLIKPIDRWYLDLVVKRLGLLIVSLSEIKSCGMASSFHMNMTKQTTFQGSSLNHSIKKGIFLRGKTLKDMLMLYAKVTLRKFKGQSLPNPMPLSFPVLWSLHYLYYNMKSNSSEWLGHNR